MSDSISDEMAAKHDWDAFHRAIDTFRESTVGLPLTQAQFDANCKGMADIILAEQDKLAVETLMEKVRRGEIG